MSRGTVTSIVACIPGFVVVRKEEGWDTWSLLHLRPTEQLVRTNRVAAEVRARIGGLLEAEDYDLQLVDILGTASVEVLSTADIDLGDGCCTARSWRRDSNP